MNIRQNKAMFFLASQAITLFGSTLVQMAIIWYVTLNTGEGIWVAAFSVASYLPQFVVSFMGGVWADRYNKKTLIIGADIGIALITFAMWLAMPYIGDEPLMLTLLLVMSVLRSTGAGIQTPAVNAVLPLLVPEDSLMRYNGINATMQSIVQFAAPAAAGAVLTVSKLSPVLLIDVITAAIGIGIFCLVSLPKQAPKQTLSVISDMKQGLSYVTSSKLLSGILTVYGLFVLLSVPAGFLAQLFVSREFGNTYWYLTAVEVVGFLGMMAGGIIVSTRGGEDHIRMLSVGLVAFGLLAVCMGLSNSFVLYLILMLLYGVPLTVVQTTITTMLQQNTEEAMQGRIFGLMSMMFSAFLPLGMAIFGPMADAVSMRLLMHISGVLTALIGIIIWVNPKRI